VPRVAPQCVRLFQYRFEDRLEVTGRGIDDLQHLGRRGLLLQRLAQLGQQPRVLDRDDRLVGKGAHQFDLPLSERLDPLPREIDRAEHGPLAQQRHPKDGTPPDRCNPGQRVVWISEDVRNMHDLAFESHPPGYAVATGENCSLAQNRPMLGIRCNPRVVAM
jgi:hypothetical protein